MAERIGESVHHSAVFAFGDEMDDGFRVAGGLEQAAALH